MLQKPKNILQRLCFIWVGLLDIRIPFRPYLIIRDFHPTVKKFLIGIAAVSHNVNGTIVLYSDVLSSYTKIVVKGMTKAEMILKVVMAPTDPAKAFTDQFAKLLPEADPSEFQKVLDMKVGHISADTSLLSLTYSLGVLQYRIRGYLSADIAACATNMNISCFFRN